MITKEEYELYEKARKKLKIKVSEKNLNNVMKIMEETKLDLKVVITIMDKHEEVRWLMKNG